MKALVALTLGMLLAAPSLAQSPPGPNELFVAIGDPGLVFALNDAAEDIFRDVFSGGDDVTYGDQLGGFQVAVGYQRRLGSWASVGVTGSWAGTRETMYVNGVEQGKVERRLLALMADARAHWFRRPAWDLYSGVALGVSSLSDEFLALSSSEDDSFNPPAFQILPIGARYGRDTGGFLETGLGTNGFIKAGLSQRF